ncbi:MAG TPA: SDR family oxidoreductase [Chthoniobacterales bacterium]|nr:SDR family oxidoreductase [Chthoniobacterales bacterium]
MKILITGVSGGIGLSLAGLFQEEEVWGLARRPPAEALRCRFTPCDLCQWTEVERVARKLKQTWGKLDAMIHCAGVQGAVGKAMELDPQAWADTVRSNIESAYFALRAFFPLLLHDNFKRRKVILFSGGGASRPRPFFSAYGCAKTALVRLVETLAAEWIDLAIDVNIVAPGAINTAMTRDIVQMGPQRAGEEEYRRAQAQLESGGDSLAKLHELVRFLVSEDSEGVTGRFISAQWDSQESIIRAVRDHSEAYTLRRLVS